MEIEFYLFNNSNKFIKKIQNWPKLYQILLYYYNLFIVFLSDCRANRSKTGVLADHLVEFNNNSEVRDRDVVDTQKLRQEVLPPMWDVYEKTSPSESGNYCKCCNLSGII